jgi:hypothetical protein
MGPCLAYTYFRRWWDHLRLEPEGSLGKRCSEAKSEAAWRLGKGDALAEDLQDRSAASDRELLSSGEAWHLGMQRQRE